MRYSRACRATEYCPRPILLGGGFLCGFATCFRRFNVGGDFGSGPTGHPSNFHRLRDCAIGYATPDSRNATAICGGRIADADKAVVSSSDHFQHLALIAVACDVLRIGATNEIFYIFEVVSVRAIYLDCPNEGSWLTLVEVRRDAHSR